MLVMRTAARRNSAAVYMRQSSDVQLKVSSLGDELVEVFLLTVIELMFVLPHVKLFHCE